jgi:hypothetical protein
MNPGLIPPEEVAAAAKKGLELSEKFRPGGTSVGIQRAKQLAGRRDVWLRERRRDERLLCSARGRQGVEKPRMGRRKRSLGCLYRLVAVGAGRRWADGLPARLNKTAAE